MHWSYKIQFLDLRRNIRTSSTFDPLRWDCDTNMDQQHISEATQSLERGTATAKLQPMDDRLSLLMAEHGTIHDCNKECPSPCPLLPPTGESDSIQSADLPLSEEQSRHLLAGYNVDEFNKKLQSAEGPETFSSILQQFQSVDTRHQTSQILIADYERQMVHIREKCEEMHKANKLMTDRLDRISGKLIATKDFVGETKDRHRAQATPASHPVLNAQSCVRTAPKLGIGPQARVQGCIEGPRFQSATGARP